MNKLRTQQGATLIETMIALLVLAVGLMGFAALLTNTLTMNQRAFTLSQAVMLADDYVERIRMNREQAVAYDMDLDDSPAASPTDCTSVTCTAAQMAEWDKKQWFDLLAAQLPAGDAEITVDELSTPMTVDIEISYELRIGRVGKGSDAEVEQMKVVVGKLSSYSMSTEI